MVFAIARVISVRDPAPVLNTTAPEGDIFALSSDSEGMSNTIIEAMAAGRPVLATDVGGNSELVVPNQTGLLVEARSPEALARGIQTLAAAPAAREAMGAAGRLRAERDFSLRRMLEEYELMYLNVAEGLH